jgi:hypothetical protein
MTDLLIYGLLLAFVAAAVWAAMYLTNLVRANREKKLPNHRVVKRDWVPTGRIDFATPADPKNPDQQSEFKLLVEERRIVESIAGNENLEIQWRLATLNEAKAVVTQYHAYLSENSLIKSVVDEPALLVPAMSAQGNSSEAPSRTGEGTVAAAKP